MFFFISFGYLDLADAEALSTALALSGEKLKGSVLTIEKAEAKQESPSKVDKGTKQVYGEEKGMLLRHHKLCYNLFHLCFVCKQLFCT